MKRALFSLAVLGVSMQAAQAQSSVTIYGVTDVGYVLDQGGPQGSVSKLTSGIGYGSRLGFKGVEDLGGGLSAKFVLEAGFNVDNGSSAQGGIFFGRQSFVGLSGSAGSVTVGRQYTPYYLAMVAADPFITGYAGAATNLMSNGGGRVNNAILYVTPTIAGFTGEFEYALGEVAGNNAASRVFDSAIGYANGPFALKYSYHNANDANAIDGQKNSLLFGTYDFGFVKAHLAYAHNKGTSTINSDDVMAGVTVPFGQHKILASVVFKNDKTSQNRDASQFAAGYVYAMSKRTELYTAYGYINNKNGATYTVGNGGELGTGNRAINLGLRHFF
ncbi:MAG: porin [Herminiimonas sp.]|nr:porin [Herminiimonas sp.]